ncbi:hypothetical protein [Lysobacter sp. HA35]
MTIDPLVAWMYRPVVALSGIRHQGRFSCSLEPGEILDVIVSATGNGFLNVREPGTGVVKTNVAITSGTTTTIGPYNVNVEVRVDSWKDDINFNIARLNS